VFIVVFGEATRGLTRGSRQGVNNRLEIALDKIRGPENIGKQGRGPAEQVCISKVVPPKKATKKGYGIVKAKRASAEGPKRRPIN